MHNKVAKREGKMAVLGHEINFGLYLLMEIVIIVLYSQCAEYSSQLEISTTKDSSSDTLKYYPFF